MTATSHPLPEPTDLDLLELVIIHAYIDRQPKGVPGWRPSLPEFENRALARRARRITQDWLVHLYQHRIDAWWAERGDDRGYAEINAHIRERNQRIMAAAMWAVRTRSGQKIAPCVSETAARLAVHSNSSYGTVLRRDEPGGAWIDVVSIPLEPVTAASRIRYAVDAA